MTRPMPTLELTVDRPEEILDRWFTTATGGGLTVDGDLAYPAGTQCTLTLLVKAASQSFQFRARVAWVRRKGSKTLRPSYGLELMEKPATLDRLRKLAQTQFPAGAARVGARFRVKVMVSLAVGDQLRHGRLGDLSLGGAFVLGDAALTPGTRVQLKLRAPWSLRAIQIEGEVVWNRSEAPSGMGVRFLQVSDGTTARLRRLLERLSARDQ